MDKMYKWFIVVCILSIALTGCASDSNKDDADLEKQFSTAIPIADINKSLEVDLSQESKSFQSGSRIELIIRNKSPYPLFFEKTSHIRLMGSVDNHTWVKVKNAMNYVNDMSLMPSGTVLLDARHTLIRPIVELTDLNSGDNDILLRIVIVAEIMAAEKHTGQEVAAYVDVNLKP